MLLQSTHRLYVCMHICEWATDQVDSRPQLRVRWRLLWQYVEFLSKRSAEVRCDDSYEYNNKVEQNIFLFFPLIQYSL